MSQVVVFAGVGVVVSCVLIGVGFAQWRVKRLIENTPTCKIRSIAMGLVEVFGSVEKPLKSALEAPFTGKECVYYSFKIEEQRVDSKGNTYWVTLHSGEQSVPFYVKDSTGVVLVDPQGSTLEIPADFTLRTGMFTKVPGGVKEFCKKSNIGIASWLGTRTLSFTEYHLAPKDKVFILGTAGDNPHVKEGTASQGVDDVMIQKGKHHPFFIADKDEKEVLKGFALKAYGLVFGGSLIFLACFGYVLWTFGFF